MKTSITYLLVFLIFLFACNTTPKELKKGLPMIIVKLGDSFNKSDSSGNEGLVIRFYENGTYSHFGYNFFSFGNWIWDERKNTVTLNPTTAKDKNFTQQFRIEKKFDDSYSIKKLIVRDGKTLIQRMESGTITLSKLTNKDPFSKEMNAWRVKPTASESVAAIKLRTLNYLSFLLAYYELIKENETNVFTYGWYATPIQMHYGNGVRMAYSNELTDWYACFYSVDEGNEAYKLIAAGMQKTKIKSFESRAERNLEYIKQLIIAIQ